MGLWTPSTLDRSDLVWRQGKPYWHVGDHIDQHSRFRKRLMPAHIGGANDSFSVAIGPFATAIGANFNTFTARQFVDPLPVPVLDPSRLQPGSKLKLEAEGEFSTTATPTLVLGFALGILGATGSLGTPVVLAESAAITTGSGAASWPWRLEYRGIVTAVGTAGSITGEGDLELGTSLTALSTSPIPVTLALRTVAIDTTIQRGVGVVATWGTSSVSNNVRVYNVSAVILNYT